MFGGGGLAEPYFKKVVPSRASGTIFSKSSSDAGRREENVDGVK